MGNLSTGSWKNLGRRKNVGKMYTRVKREMMSGACGRDVEDLLQKKCDFAQVAEVFYHA